MSQTINLTTKNIKEFTPQDTIYLHKTEYSGGMRHKLLLCQFLSFEKGKVTGKVLAVEPNGTMYKSQIEAGWIETAPLGSCSLFGTQDEAETHNTHHYFDPIGHAAHETAEVRHLRVPEEHPSYGMLSINKTQASHATPCFGSPLLHRHTIRLVINSAKLHRTLHEDRFHAGKQLIEVEMTQQQFAEMLTSPNSMGTPVTIKSIGYERMEPCPFVSKFDQFENELETKIKKLTHDARISMQNLSKMVGESKLNKTEKAHFLREIQQLNQEMQSNMPFLLQQMTEEMGRVAGAAKSSILTFIKEQAKAHGLPEIEISEILTIEQETKPTTNHEE